MRASTPSRLGAARSSVATFAPSARRRAATAAPIPLAAPVTSATRPKNRSSFVTSAPYKVSAMTFDPTVDYPLGSRRPDLVETPSGLALEEVTLESARAGTLVAADVRATSATLRRQAEVARATGRRQLADNLERAAELAGVPDDQLLAIYTALRPGRSTPAELEEWARPARRLGCAADGRLRPRGGGRLRGTRARRCLRRARPVRVPGREGAAARDARSRRRPSSASSR